MDALEEAYAATLRCISSPAWADDFLAVPKPVGPELDALQDDVPVEAWSPLRRALFNALGQIEPRQKLAVLSMACNEGPYLAEWIAHHLAIGVDKIFVYTNDNDDGTDEILRWFAANAPLSVIPVKSGPHVNVQQKNYRHALALLPELRLYDWVAVIDADEFLLPAARYDHNMRNMLAAAPADTEALLFGWRARQWRREFARTPGLLAERFPHAVPSGPTKCVTRLRHVTALRWVHFPEFDVPCVMRDSEFTVIGGGANWHIQPRPETGGVVEHFWGRSFEEFLVKIRRGEAMAVNGKAFHRSYDDYFSGAETLTPQNLQPWPEAMLNATKETLARFAAKPGFAHMQALVEARYDAYATRVRADTALRQIYAEGLARFPR